MQPSNNTSMSLCVCVCKVCVCMCVCALASASFTLSQPLSHVSMNHNMQLNINHCIGFGASHAETLLILLRSRAPKKTQRKKNPLNSDTGWVLFSLVMLVYSITCSSDEWSQRLVSKADGGNIKNPQGCDLLWTDALLNRIWKHIFDLQNHLLLR